MANLRKPLKRAETVETEPPPNPFFQPAAPLPRATAAATCSLCGQTPRAPVDAGGDLGRVCQPCFTEWDQRQEALQMMLASTFGLSPAGVAAGEAEVDDLLSRPTDLPCRPPGPACNWEPGLLVA